MKIIAVTIFTVFVCSACGLFGGEDENKSTKFEAGPILFIYEGNLWSMEEDGADVKQLTHYEYPNFSIGDARWSPDASKIAVVGPADPGNAEEGAGAIYIMNADGSGRYKLTNPPLGWFRYVGDLARNFTWSPDGQKIAFSRMRPPEALGTFDVFIIDLETKVETLVSESKQVRDWNPYSEELLLSFTENGWRRLGLLNLNKDSIEVFGSLDFNYGSGRISPDGSKIAYTKGGNFYVLDFEDNEEVLLFDKAESPSPNAWSPSGDRIVFQTWASSYEDREIYTLDLETKKITNITPFSSLESWIWVSSWRGR
ncbi:MAG: hypothetical protein WD059_00585 [Balneolaceae bacterium]